MPGGAQHAFDSLEVTRPEAALRTVEVHEKAFGRPALRRPSRAPLASWCNRASSSPAPKSSHTSPRRQGASRERWRDLPGFVFEAHSTDYQPAASLDALVRDGFAILKVGPWLTFALREALYGLDGVACVLDPASKEDGLPAAMEALMLKEPGNWRKYYDGSA